VHVGYEPSAVLGAHPKLGDTWKMLTWQLRGRMGGARKQNGANRGSNGHGNGHGGEHSKETHAAIPPASHTDLVSSDGRLRVL